MGNCSMVDKGNSSPFIGEGQIEINRRSKNGRGGGDEYHGIGQGKITSPGGLVQIPAHAADQCGYGALVGIGGGSDDKRCKEITGVRKKIRSGNTDGNKGLVGCITALAENGPVAGRDNLNGGYFDGHIDRLSDDVKVKSNAKLLIRVGDAELNLEGWQLREQAQ